jgi:hypothetical protein
MNELLERERPAVLVECPWCDGPVELLPGAHAIACEGCMLTLELAPDEPARGASTRELCGTRA